MYVRDLSAFVNSLCEVRDIENNLLIVGIVSETGDGSIGIVDRFKKNIIQVEKYKYLKVSIYNSRIGFKILSGYVLLSTKDTLYLNGVQFLVDSDNRGQYRAITHIPCKLRSLIQLDLSTANMIDATLVNISLNGLAFTTDGLIDSQKPYIMVVNLNDKTCEFIIRVVRFRSLGNDIREYGCIIERMDISKTALNDFILKIQREEVNRLLT